MKIHKATLIGLTNTKPSTTNEGFITASSFETGDVLVSADSIKYRNASTGNYDNVISNLAVGKYINTDSILDFPIEVSRSAAEFGFGGGSTAGVTRIIPGAGISVSQQTGDVIITNTGGGGGGTFPYVGNADISGSLTIITAVGFEDEDLLVVGDPQIDGKVKVNKQGVLKVEWSGSTPPEAVEGGMYYSQSSFFVGV